MGKGMVLWMPSFVTLHHQRQPEQFTHTHICRHTCILLLTHTHSWLQKQSHDCPFWGSLMWEETWHWNQASYAHVPSESEWTRGPSMAAGGDTGEWTGRAGDLGTQRGWRRGSGFSCSKRGECYVGWKTGPHEGGGLEVERWGYQESLFGTLESKSISGPAASSSRNGEEHPGSSAMTTTWRNALTIDSKRGMWPLGGWGGQSPCCGSRQAENSFFFLILTSLFWTLWHKPVFPIQRILDKPWKARISHRGMELTL